MIYNPADYTAAEYSEQWQNHRKLQLRAGVPMSPEGAETPISFTTGPRVLELCRFCMIRLPKLLHKPGIKTGSMLRCVETTYRL